MKSIVGTEILMWHIPYANSKFDSYVSLPSCRNEILMARSMHERSAFGFLRLKVETFGKKAPFFATFLLTCNFEEDSASCRWKRTEDGPFKDFLLISSYIQSFQKAFDFEVKM